jgi:hypothetical protein
MTKAAQIEDTNILSKITGAYFEKGTFTLEGKNSCALSISKKN